MRAVLGIDAAWTPHHNSSIAFVVESSQGWKCRRLSASVGEFCEQDLPLGLDAVERILEICRQLEPSAIVSIIACDMPLSTGTIVGRRAADNQVSQIFGGMGASTHSPIPTRPGQVSECFRDACNREGFALATTIIGAQSLIEVYPHPAIIRLLQLEYRLPYKAANVHRYWPDLAPEDRILNLYESWSQLVRALSNEIAFEPIVEYGSTLKARKRIEDKLDALICAWVGIKALDGNSEPYGDHSASIWIPIV